MIYDYIITKPPLDEETLMHYGVKGMHWGRRKKELMAQGYSRRLARKQFLIEKHNAKIDKKRLASIELKDAKKAYRKSLKDYGRLEKNTDLYKRDPKKWQKQASDVQRIINKNENRLTKAKLNKELSKGKMTKKVERLKRKIDYDKLLTKYDDPDKVHEIALKGSKQSANNYTKTTRKNRKKRNV